MLILFQKECVKAIKGVKWLIYAIFADVLVFLALLTVQKLTVAPSFPPSIL